ncbi:16289_t:CDS:2, partial [Funneliformis mosseae]
YCIINGASAPYGDAFLGLDVNLKLGKPNEVHQYKRWKAHSLSAQDYQNERKKAHAYANVGPLNINKASRRDLLSVYGIGETWADKIMTKREFKDIEDAKKKD